MMPDEILRVENLTVRYRSADSKQKTHQPNAAGNTGKAGTQTAAAGDTDRTETGIRNVSFSLKRGELCGIIGESGGGKSTLLSGIMGLLQEKRSYRTDKKTR